MKRFVALLLFSFLAFSGSYASAYAQESVTNKSIATGWASVSPTPDQFKEFFAQIESGRITKEKLQAFLQTDSATNNQVAQTGSATTSESVARDIMGDDIMFPEEVAKWRGLSYTEAQLKQLSDTIPTADVLRWGKEKGYALMPSPPKAMSLLDVRKLKDDHFNSTVVSHYEGEAFASNDKTTFGWLMIKKTPVDGSLKKSWDEQKKLLSEVERVPNAAEMSWFITTFYEVRRARLFEDIQVRTFSLNGVGNRVDIGNFNDRGLAVNIFHDDDRGDLLGLVFARKLP